MSKNVLEIADVLYSIKNQESKVEATKNVLFPFVEENSSIPDEYRFSITIRAISEKEATKISKKINTRKFNRETQRHEVVIDSEAFVDIVFRSIVTGWENLTVKKWRYFVKTYPLNNFDDDLEIPFSIDLAKILIMEGIGLGDSVAGLMDKARDVLTFNSEDEIAIADDVSVEDEIKN